MTNPSNIIIAINEQFAMAGRGHYCDVVRPKGWQMWQLRFVAKRCQWQR